MISKKIKLQKKKLIKLKNTINIKQYGSGKKQPYSLESIDKIKQKTDEQLQKEEDELRLALARSLKFTNTRRNVEEPRISARLEKINLKNYAPVKTSSTKKGAQYANKEPVHIREKLGTNHTIKHNLNMTSSNKNKNISNIKTLNNAKRLYNNYIIQCNEKIKTIKNPNVFTNQYVNLQTQYKNSDNLSYLHSLLQLLRNIPELFTILKKIIDNTNIEINIHNIIFLFYVELTRSGGPTENTVNLINNCPSLEIITRNVRNETTGKITQIPTKYGNIYDPFDVLVYLIKLLSDIKDIDLSFMMYNTGQTYYDINDNFVLKSPKVEPTCLLYSIELMDLNDEQPIDVDNKIEIDKKKFIDVQSILNKAFKRTEEIDFNINTDKEPVYEKRKKINYIEIPNELIYIGIQLIIFSWGYGEQIRKINFEIQNIDRYICINGVLFKLISLIMHDGNSPTSGHYVNYSKQKIPDTSAAAAEIKQGDETSLKWVLYDDKRDIKKNLKTSKTLSKLINPQYTPYILLFKRVPDIPDDIPDI